MSILMAQTVGPWNHHMDGWGWGPVLWWLLLALVVGLIAWLIWSVTRGGERRSSSHPTALEVLAERYARGEIDRDEYLQRKADLQR